MRRRKNQSLVQQPNSKYYKKLKHFSKDNNTIDLFGHVISQNRHGQQIITQYKTFKTEQYKFVYTLLFSQVTITNESFPGKSS